MASIYDIAKEAGVSYSTVSLILNNRGDEIRISKKTQERVRKIAREMGYVPNLNARKLIQKSYDNLPEIALLWAPTQHPIFLNSMIQTMNDLSKKEMIRPMSVTIYPFENGHVDKLEKILLGNVAHGLIIPVASEKDIAYLRQIDIQVPVITIYNNTRKYYSVDVDNYLNGQTAAKIFETLGRKRVALVNNIYMSNGSKGRTRGFRDYCIDHGMEIVSETTQRPDTIHKKSNAMDNYMKGKTLTWKMLDAGIIPDGIFAQDDDSTRGVIHALRARNISVPEDVAVIGYGYNSKENAEEKRLTLIGYPMEELTEQTWLLMHRILAGEEEKPRRILCESPVYYGRSCPKPHDS
ncbi:MAG TPA: LacI family DNA-binding transcriptional regulator [Candidatus Scybalocola faecavium]|nr:LacI family DNA-binding transcriptional regulator [Candidatus Scybalocola faecavium]